MQCNMCEAKGGENENFLEAEGLTKHNGFIRPIEFSGSYHSTHLSDLTNYKISLCEACIRNILNSCKIEPTMTTSFGNKEIVRNISFEEDKKQMELSAWIHSKEYQEAYFKKKCNFKIQCPNEALYSIVYPSWEDLPIQPTKDCFCEECLIKFKEQQIKLHNPKKVDFDYIVSYLDPSLWNFL